MTAQRTHKVCIGCQLNTIQINFHNFLARPVIAIAYEGSSIKTSVPAKLISSTAAMANLLIRTIYFIYEFLVLNVKIWYYIFEAIFRKIVPRLPKDISRQIVLITGKSFIFKANVQLLSTLTFVLRRRRRYRQGARFRVCQMRSAYRCLGHQPGEMVITAQGEGHFQMSLIERCLGNLYGREREGRRVFCVRLRHHQQVGSGASRKASAKGYRRR